jgi:peptidoglycan/LPS O-acetylase OafA/YrhL
MNYRSDIEGLRAIGILLVVGYHANIPGFGGGFIGVDVFFVLSGYLISNILTQELLHSGSINFVNFYARRARRLVPGLALTLICTLVASWIIYSPIEQVDIAKTAISTSIYLSNVWFARQATDYLAADSETNPLLHTWSLSVEEQFYLVWPLLLYFVFRQKIFLNKPRTIAMMVIIIGLLSLLAEIVFTSLIQPWAFFLTPFRVWQFAIGALAAMASAHLKPLPMLQRTSATNLLSYAGIALILGCGSLYTRETIFPGIAAFIPCLGTVLVLYSGACDKKTHTAAVLSTKPFIWIGKVSYSWYLWHWPVLVIGGVVFGHGELSQRIALAILSLLISALAYKFFENPIRFNKTLSATAKLSLYSAAATIMLTLISSIAWKALATTASKTPEQQLFTKTEQDLPAVYSQGCHLNVLDKSSPPCLFNATGTTETWALFGDSHAAQWFPAIEEAAIHHKASVLSLTKSECPVPRTPFFNQRLGRIYTECDQWREETLQRIAAAKPAIIFLSSSYHYPIKDDEWGEGLQKTIQTLSTSGAKIIILGDTPWIGINIPKCLARAQWMPYMNSKGCNFDVASSINAKRLAVEREIAAGSERTEFFEFTNQICDAEICTPLANGVVKFRDSNHLSVAFVKQLSSSLEKRLQHKKADSNEETIK